MRWKSLWILWMALFGAASLKGSDNKWTIGGYVQANPVYIGAELPPPFERVNWMEYRLQNRLNLKWSPTDRIDFHLQMRTRFFAGDLVENIPSYAEGIGRDDGLVDLSWTVFDRPKWLLHHIPDRFYFQYYKEGWDIRVGRQRVNWGVNMITNPNDLFNIYSFYDFDYRERPGSDAIRIQRFLDFGERMELAIRPARRIENSVAAFLYAFRYKDYDLQAIVGYFQNRLTAGGGWAGNLKSAGLKGELMFFKDLKDNPDRRSFNVVTAVSVDYMFPSGLFFVTEFLYNHDGGQEAFLLLGENLSPDNPSFSRYQISAQVVYPLHPLLDLIYANIYYPDERAVFLSPGLNWSVAQALDFQLLGQIFIGSSDSALSNAANVVTASLRYNY